MLAAEAHAQDDGGGGLVKAELSAQSTTPAAPVKNEHPAPLAAVDGDEASAKQLKLRLFQQLTRRHRHAWPQYWRALQQYLVARLSQDELQCILAILLGPDLVELHNAFIVAILSQTRTMASVSDTATSGEDDKAAALLWGRDEGSKTKASVKEELPSVKRDADPSEEAASRVKADPQTSDSKKRSFSSRVSSSEEEKAVKKLLHFANSKRDTPEKQHADHQSAELLIGLGGFGSRASQNSLSPSPSSQ